MTMPEVDREGIVCQVAMILPSREILVEDGATESIVTTHRDSTLDTPGRICDRRHRGSMASCEPSAFLRAR